MMRIIYIYKVLSIYLIVVHICTTRYVVVIKDYCESFIKSTRQDTLTQYLLSLIDTGGTGISFSLVLMLMERV